MGVEFRMHRLVTIECNTHLSLILRWFNTHTWYQMEFLTHLHNLQDLRKVWEGEV